MASDFSSLSPEGSRGTPTRQARLVLHACRRPVSQAIDLLRQAIDLLRYYRKYRRVGFPRRFALGYALFMGDNKRTW